MPPKRPFLLYLRSRLNLRLSLAAAALLILAIAFLRKSSFLPALAIVIVYLAVSGLLYFSRVGARQVVAEEDEDQAAKVKARIDAASALRERIAVLRVGDERVAAALEYFLQESGAYIEECRRRGTWSPVANDRIDRVLTICQVWMSERDEAATARRYDQPALGADGAAPADPVPGLVADIRECAGTVRARITEDLLGGSDQERLAIAKELDKDT
jgi:hypothetical protein